MTAMHFVHRHVRLIREIYEKRRVVFVQVCLSSK